MVERSLSMREVPGSIPGASKFFFSLLAGHPNKVGAFSLRRWARPGLYLQLVLV